MKYNFGLHHMVRVSQAEKGAALHFGGFDPSLTYAGKWFISCQTSVSLILVKSS